MNFLNELKSRNTVLYYFGWLYFIGGVTAAVMTQASDTIVLGINARIKPMKFFFSIRIFSWTMAWYLNYLDNRQAVKKYTLGTGVIGYYFYRQKRFSVPMPYIWGIRSADPGISGDAPDMIICNVVCLKGNSDFRNYGAEYVAGKGLSPSREYPAP